MQTFLLKIVSAIMSVFFFITSLIPGLSLNEPKMVKDIKVFDGLFISFIGREDYHVFQTYEEWNFYCSSNQNSIKEYTDSVDESVFDESNIVAINICYADSSWKTKVTSALQVGNSLEVEYVGVQEQSFISLPATHNSVILVETNKHISKVKTTEIDSIEIPFILDGQRKGWFSIVDTEIHGLTEEFDGYSRVFSDFESWKEFLDSGKYEFKYYADSIDEKYFETQNLAVYVVATTSGSDVRIENPDIKDGNLLINYYLVSQPGVYPDIETYQTIFVETDKTVSNITPTLKNSYFSVPFILEGETALCPDVAFEK